MRASLIMLSLVIPCYNESENLPLLLPRCHEVVNRSDAEVILVDNGSSDATPDVLACLLPQYPGCRTVRVETNRGYGHGICAGLRLAEGDVLGWTHADMQTNPVDAVTALQVFEEQGGSAFVKGHRYGRPFGDTIFTVGMSVFETVLLRARLWDINAQPTLFPRTFFESWSGPPDDFSLDLYAYYWARRAGLPVRRFPVVFGERAFGRSHWNVNWSSKVRFIRRTLDYSFRLRSMVR